MINVRRQLYDQASPAGKGTKWEWAGPNGSGDWNCYSMKVQCIVEAAWATVCVFFLARLRVGEYTECSIFHRGI